MASQGQTVPLPGQDSGDGPGYPEGSQPGPGSRAEATLKFPHGGCLYERFEARAETSPDAEALLVAGQRITYRELNARANRIAHTLVAMGVGPDSLVGIFLDRSAEMVAAVLAVLKAGGAYLPLDPAYPTERLSFMIEDARARIVLTESSLAGRLGDLGPVEGAPRKVVSLDSEPAIAGASSKNLSRSAEASDLAYVIYTSGSTGQPKGVAVMHSNAVALVEWASQVYSARELDGVLAGTSLCFDPSILELFTPLSLGGKVIMARNSLALSNLDEAHEVRMIFSVPSVVREMLRMGGLPASLETINMGGEPLHEQLVDQLYALPHVKKVYDLFGPTETSTCSIYALRTPGGPATIGRPIAKTTAHLLDRDLLPVPVGATGELFIGGAGVTRGYVNRPETTAERFVELTLPGGHPTRFYRTGDFCRFRSDGSLEFAGRQDRQVKIRGFRVELGEIESALEGHPAVEQAVVVAHEEAQGDRRLIAYVVPRALSGKERKGTVAAMGSSIVSQLRLYLKGRLPDFMVPGTFMLLERFELTTNGKIRRESLPPPTRLRVAEGDFRGPRTSTEALLCEIWAELLGLPQIGVNDDLFELGGDSLTGVAMIGAVEQRTGHRLPVGFLQQTRTVARLAEYLDRRGKCCKPAMDSPMLGIQPRGTRPPLFLVHGVGGGMLWGYENLARHLGKDQPVFAFKACDPDRLDEFDTITKIAAYFVRELRRFQPEGPYAIGGYCFGGNVAHEMACQIEKEGQSVSLLALIGSSPRNSSYDRVRWTPAHAWRFSRNLWHWSVDFTRWKFAKQRRFVTWKFMGLHRKAAHLLRKRGRYNVGELVDLSAVPSSQRSLWVSHVRALDNHKADVFSGKVVLLRAQGHRLNCSYAPDCGWGEFARGGVSERVIPGFHDGLLDEPFGASTADALKAELALAHSRDGIQQAAATRGGAV